MLEVTSDDTPAGHQAGHSVLLIRRHRYTGTLSYYRCWTPGPAALAQLIAAAVLRRRIEENHQIAKQATGPGRRAGHPLEILAPLDRHLPARLHLPGHRRRRATPARPQPRAR
jgi:hypothetical protein